MSLDYPFYLELKKRKSPAAKWWRVGDVLYYLGLVPAILSLIATPILSLFENAYWHYSLGIFMISVIVFIVGSSLKGKSYRMAAKEGINPDVIKGE